MYFPNIEKYFHAAWIKREDLVNCCRCAWFLASILYGIFFERYKYCLFAETRAKLEYKNSRIAVGLESCFNKEFHCNATLFLLHALLRGEGIEGIQGILIYAPATQWRKKNALLKARPNAIFTARFPARGWLKSKVTHRPYKATRFDVSLVPSFSIAPFSRFLALSAAVLAWPRNYRSVRVACLSTRRGQTSRVISRARFQLHSTAYFARRKPRCSVPDTISWRNLIDRENKLSLRGLGKS